MQIPLTAVLSISLLLLFGVNADHDAAVAATVTNCTEAALDAAIAGGGEVTFSCSGTIAFASEKIVRAGTTLVIDGAGQNVVFTGQGNKRLFQVLAGAELTLRNLTLRDGHAEGLTGTDGGAVIVLGPLSDIPGARLFVSNSVFEGHSATNGGAISSLGSVSISNSVFRNNTGLHGGAISSFGTLSLDADLFEANSATNTGGAIFAQGQTTIASTTFVNNSATLVAGGMASTAGTLAIVNTTFRGNSAGTGAGGLSLTSGRIVNSTFHGNTGGALRSSETVMMANSILASSIGGPDCDGLSPASDGGGNLVADGSCGFPAGGNPQLGPLQDNGGPTPTMSIARTSPAFGTGVRQACDAPSPTGAGHVDQRGSPRASCSAGAFEPLPDLPHRRMAAALASDR